MHTNKHTEHPNGSYLLLRHGSYYYNRRVPNHAIKACGKFVRVRLSRDQTEAELTAQELTRRLDALWKGTAGTIEIDLKALAHLSRPKKHDLSSWAAEYVQLKSIDPAQCGVAVEQLTSLVGDKDVRDLSREDARDLITYLLNKGRKSATVRRRLGSIAAVLNYAYSELEIDKRNPFSRVLIQGEGQDAKKRDVFTEEELREGYREALGSGRHIRLLMPLLGETGCRLGEIVGLRIQDIDLEGMCIQITPHSARRLKTRGSEREIPLVGYAFQAMKLALGDRTEGYLFEQYLRDGTILCTHASNAVSKWLKGRFEGKTAHCLRHTFRDRLRAVECPLEMIDALGGWSSIGTAGSRYGRGFSLEHKRHWLERIALD